MSSGFSSKQKKIIVLFTIMSHVLVNLLYFLIYEHKVLNKSCLSCKLFRCAGPNVLCNVCVMVILIHEQLYIFQWIIITSPNLKVTCILSMFCYGLHVSDWRHWIFNDHICSFCMVQLCVFVNL